MDKSKLSTKKMIAYSVTETALLMISFMFASQYLFFMTDILEISAGAAGTMFLITRIWDAINDPIMGVIADKHESKSGKYRPFILIGGIPLAVGLPLAFTDFHFSPFWSLAYVYLTYTIFGMAYTCIFIPYTSMIGRITCSREDRMRLSNSKGGFQCLGVLLSSSCAVPLVKFFGGDGTLNAKGYQSVALLFMVIALIFFAATYFHVHENPPDKQEITIPKYKVTFRLFSQVILKNRNLIILAIIYFFMYMRMFLNNGSMNYFFIYIRENPSMIAPYMTIIAATQGLMAFFMPGLSRKYGKRKVTTASMGLASLAYLAFYFLRMASPAVFFGIACVLGLTCSAPYLLIWSFVTDVADETEVSTHVRADGLMISTTSFANKLGAAVAGTVSGFVLEATGYVPDAVQTATAVNGIESLMFILPGLCCLIIFLLLLAYNIKD